jgi:hypothetical protein
MTYSSALWVPGQFTLLLGITTATTSAPFRRSIGSLSNVSGFRPFILSLGSSPLSASTASPHTLLQASPRRVELTLSLTWFSRYLLWSHSRRPIFGLPLVLVGISYLLNLYKCRFSMLTTRRTLALRRRTTSWIGPSITPLTDLNSGFRLYEVDPSVRAITLFRTCS